MVIGLLVFIALGLFVGRWYVILFPSLLWLVLLTLQGSDFLEVVGGTALAILPVALGVSLRVAIFGEPQEELLDAPTS